MTSDLLNSWASVFWANSQRVGGTNKSRDRERYNDEPIIQSAEEAEMKLQDVLDTFLKKEKFLEMGDTQTFLM